MTTEWSWHEVEKLFPLGAAEVVDGEVVVYTGLHRPPGNEAREPLIPWDPDRHGDRSLSEVFDE